MGRWARSKELAAASWGVLRHDKELMVLPLISGIASLIIGASFLVPVFLLADTGTDAAGQSTFTMGPAGWVLLFVMYVVLAYVAIFFKAALLCGADERLRGGNPTLGSSLAGASGHAAKLLPWALVTATVSVVLRAIEERVGLIGRLVVGLVGLAWAVVTFLVLPILIFEGLGVGTAIKRSATLLKATWGENLIVNMGIGLIAFVLSLPGLVIIGAGIATGSIAVIIGAVALGAVWLIGVSCWSSAMTAIFQLMLYRYATQATIPQEFASVDLAAALAPKGRRAAL